PPYRLAASRVVGEPLAVQLRIAAAEVEAVDVRRLAVGERAPLHQLRACLAQEVEVLGVVELEREVSRYGNRRARALDENGRRRHRERGGERHESLEVHVSLDGLGHAVESP